MTPDDVVSNWPSSGSARRKFVVQHPLSTNRPVSVNGLARRLAMCFLLGATLWAVGGSATAPAATACVGGNMPFDWAVAHTNGGILRARLDGVRPRDDYTLDLVLSGEQVVRGDPEYENPLHAVMAAICEQSAEAGETVVILFDVRGGDYPFPIPLVYVTSGSDALDPQVLADGLAALPATDSEPTYAAPTPASGLIGAAVLAGAWLIGLLVVARRFARR